MKVCGYCKRRYAQKPGQSLRKYLDTKFCSVACKGKSRITPRLPPKPCQRCGNDIPQHLGVSAKYYYKRKFCGVACQNNAAVKVVIYNDLNDTDCKFCKNCGGRFTRNPNKSLQYWKRQKRCTIRCDGLSEDRDTTWEVNYPPEYIEREAALLRASKGDAFEPVEVPTVSVEWFSLQVVH